MTSGVRLTGYDGGGGIREDEATIVRDIFRRFAAGESLHGLVRQLGADGVPTRRGGKWSMSTVLTMLRNPRYASRVVSTSSTTDHAAPGPAIVEQAVFDVVQARLAEQQVTNRRATSRK